MKQSGYDMLYLSACAINKIKPDPDYIAHIDLERLFRMCRYHSLTAIVCTALESAEIYDKKFMEEKAKAIRKIMLLDAEREKICRFLEQNKIWYMPLKGVILKEMYPEIGMRQMSDNDILFDRSYRKQVQEYMKKRGYTAKIEDELHHDEYVRPPIYNFEMHTDLFNEKHNPKYFRYYSDVKKILIRSMEKNYEYHFKDEDFYVYMIAHEYKHYSNKGTGLRSLLDCFVYVNKKGESLNYNYIAEKLEKLGIAEFEQKSRKLCMKVFTDPECRSFSPEEREMLEYYLFSGTYGTMKNCLSNRIKKFYAATGSKSKFRYVWKRIFPPLEFYKSAMPFFYRHKILLPIGWSFRMVRGILFRRKRIKDEIQLVDELNDR